MHFGVFYGCGQVPPPKNRPAPRHQHRFAKRPLPRDAANGRLPRAPAAGRWPARELPSSAPGKLRVRHLRWRRVPLATIQTTFRKNGVLRTGIHASDRSGNILGALQQCGIANSLKQFQQGTCILRRLGNQRSCTETSSRKTSFSTETEFGLETSALRGRWAAGRL